MSKPVFPTFKSIIDRIDVLQKLTLILSKKNLLTQLLFGTVLILLDSFPMFPVLKLKASRQGALGKWFYSFFLPTSPSYFIVQFK